MPKHTQCVHSGARKDKATRGLNTPIYPSSAYEYMDAPENIYPRYFNTPNERAVVEKLCALEAAEDGLLFSSGMAAISTVMLAFLSSGDHAVIQRDIYGGTHHLITADFDRFRIDYTFVSNRPEAIAAALRKNTRLIYIESPSNPLLMITDIAAAAAIGRAHNIVTAIDNTFASPINQQPLAHGIDIVVHSATKYLAGHGDLIAGCAMGSRDYMVDLWKVRKILGGCIDPHAAWLLERSLKTVTIRVERACENARAVAEFLVKHPFVERVHYPGLLTHPEHALAKSQMKDYGGMVTIELAGDLSAAARFVDSLTVFQLAASLGGVESLVSVPAASSHFALTPEERAEAGVTEGMVRLSVGIEDARDLIDDLAQALAAAASNVAAVRA